MGVPVTGRSLLSDHMLGSGRRNGGKATFFGGLGFTAAELEALVEALRRVAVLNHVEGGPAATRVYDRYAYDAEKRDALERWARRLQAIIEGKQSKVVAIRAR